VLEGHIGRSARGMVQFSRRICEVKGLARAGSAKILFWRFDEFAFVWSFRLCLGWGLCLSYLGVFRGLKEGFS